MKRRSGTQVVRGRVYGRFWLGGEGRESVPLPAVKAGDDAAIEKRCQIIADAVGDLVAAGRADKARDLAVQLGEATGQKRVEAILRSIQTLIRVGGNIGASITFRQFGERWTKSELHRAYPDHVRKKKTSDTDAQYLERYVYPHIGSTPVRAIQLHDCEAVMSQLPPDLSRASRRHVAQVMHRLFRLAVYPAKIIDRSPLPPGFLPKLGSDKAKQYLYPDEDRKLLACKRVPLVYRIFYGLLAREGLRFSEGHGLEWADLDLERGVVRLDENKTDDARSWALDPSVAATLKAWKAMRPDLARPFAEIDTHHPAERFREAYLRAAGVLRPELFVSTDVRRPIVVHDLRATFVTVSLANDRTETWVADRTGHKSTLMIARYRRAARTLAELNLGPLSPLREALVWAEELAADQQTISKQNGGGNGARLTKRGKKAVAPPRIELGRPLGPSILNPSRGIATSSHVEKNAGSVTSDDAPSGVFADGLLIRGSQDLEQIRRDWSAYEVALEGMDR